MNFNLAHIIPDRTMHGLNGYREVIETIAWGLEALGHQTTILVNKLSRQATNIVFGAQRLPTEVLQSLPDDTIIYNLEQMRGRSLDGMRNTAIGHEVCRRFHIWDYSASNIDFWRQMGTRNPVRHVPIGWAPILRRIPRPEVQDIDVLFYGIPGDARMRIFTELCQTGATCVFVCGLYGRARDELISRSKIVLNINVYAEAKVFEVVRVSYLLANAKAVVSDIDELTDVEPDLQGAVKFSRLENITDSCLDLLNNDDLRRQLELAGQAVIERRDIRTTLGAALENYPPG